MEFVSLTVVLKEQFSPWWNEFIFLQISQKFTELGISYSYSTIIIIIIILYFLP